MGPKGYEHGWIFVGAPGVGAAVHHPVHGPGKVSRVEGDKAHVRFDRTGETHVFQRGHSDGPARIERARTPQEQRLREKDAADVEKLGLHAITGQESKAALERKLRTHYIALGDGSDDRASDLLAAHHRAEGVPVALSDRVHQEVSPEVRAHIVAQLAHDHWHTNRARVPALGVGDISGDHPGMSVAAHYNPRVGSIVYDRKTTSNADYLKPGKGNSGGGRQFSDSGSSSFLARSASHELGHHLDMTQGSEQRQAMFRALSGKIPGTTPITARTNLDNWIKKNRAPIINHVGIYASTNPLELVAELYAESRHSNSPSPAAKAVGDHLSATEGP